MIGRVTPPPLIAAQPGVLAELRAALAAAGYDDEVVSRPVRRHGYVVGTEADAAPELEEPLAMLVGLFALGRPAPVARVRAALEPVGLGGIEATGLVTVDGDWVIPEYRLRPHAQLLLAGDICRPDDPNVVSAFTGPSVKLARLTPRARARSMLDVGTGSGILAMLGARHCDRVTAIDVNPRCLMFASFNARLNDAPNVELLEGSWFEPVAGRRFDLIVCNPPYVVSPDRDFAYRDSGLPGTALLELLIRRSAEHLAPGGLALMLCTWPHQSEDDWSAAPTAAADGTGCDVLVVGSAAVDPFEYAVAWNTPPVGFMEPGVLRQTIARWLDYYRARGVGAITYGAVILRRRTSGTPWASALMGTSNVGDRASEQVSALMAGRDLLETLDERALLTRRFSLPDGLDISQRFRRQDARFLGRSAIVGLEGGLGVSAGVDPDALEVLFGCDSQRTLSEAAERAAQRRGESAERVRAKALVAARELLTHGLLQAA